MFNPTHQLVSRSRKTPVQLVPADKGYALLTETEWQRGSAPSFEIRPKLGIFCKGVPIVGYRLEPIAPGSKIPVPTAAAVPVSPHP